MCDKIINKSIFIGYDQNDNVISMIISDSRDKVNIAWIAQKYCPFRVEELSFSNLSKFDIGINGTVFLLSSDTETLQGKKYYKYRRGV